MHNIEPFHGWLTYYVSEDDENSPFFGTEHSQFYYDRAVYNYAAHPLWDDFGSESLLIKVLYANYDQGYVILEMLGVWHDLFDNDFKMLAEEVLTFFTDAGINRFIFITENIMHAYLGADDYYQAMTDELEDGWMCLIRPREHVLEEFRQYGILEYFYHAAVIDELPWRKMKPWELYALIESRISRLLPF